MTKPANRWLLICAASVMAISVSACNKPQTATDAGNTADATAAPADNSASTGAMSADNSAATNDTSANTGSSPSQ